MMTPFPQFRRRLTAHGIDRLKVSLWSHNPKVVKRTCRVWCRRCIVQSTNKTGASVLAKGDTPVHISHEAM